MRTLYRVILSAVFLLSAVIKIYDFTATVDYFSQLSRLGGNFVAWGMMAVVFLELLIGTIFAIRHSLPEIAYITVEGVIWGFLVLSIVFVVFKVKNCGCFGTIIKIDPAVTALKNVVLLIMIGHLKRYEKS